MIRQRRLRRSQAIRDTFAEITLSLDRLITPLFLVEKENWKKEISSMPGIYQYSPDLIVKQVEELYDKGLKSYILFGIPKDKDFEGSEAANPEGPVAKTTRLLKDAFDDVVIYADVCLCEYTSHGHCGIPRDDGTIQNDPSLKLLAKAALTYAKAGADWVAPSNMMDGRVSSIRSLLDEHSLEDTAILSYSSKFASAYYGPFRDAAESPPQFGDRRSYQIDFRGTKQALRELEIDEIQGADAVMVKPALAYLDIIAKGRAVTELPLYAYNVSGEYSMIKFGAKQGLFDEKKMVLENLTAIHRAGADAILTYHTIDIVNNGWLL